MIMNTSITSTFLQIAEVSHGKSATIDTALEEAGDSDAVRAEKFLGFEDHPQGDGVGCTH